jgi:signal transduction histidine kinase
MSGIKDIDGAVDISVGGVNYGKLKVIATPEYYLSRLWEQIFTGLIMFALFIFLNTFFLWNTLRKNLLPALKDIENGAMSIYNGNLSFRVDENSTIELQSTLKAFNAMALAIEEDTEKLKQTELELQSINSELQSRVEVESTKRVESERMLLQQSKMAMMGEMIGAIAHQWRQPLNSLGIYIQDAFLAYKLGEINDEYMNEFKTGSMSIIQRMSKTIDDFRNFFRPNKEKEVFVVEDALRDTLHIMLPQLKSHSINVEFDTSCVNKVFGYKNELEQVVLIMISNAKDVLVDNNIENPKIDILINVDNTSNKVILSIEDNGGGVPEKIIDRIFEPYFTTKEQGKGTGIGLYMAKEIIERQMGGKIYCENIKNGARFVVEVQGYKDSTEQV